MTHVSHGDGYGAPPYGTFCVDYAVVLILERDNVDLDAAASDRDPSRPSDNLD